MYKVDSILNKPCKLFAKDGAEFFGVFSMPKNDVWFTGTPYNETAIKIIRDDNELDKPTLCGNVMGVPVTLQRPQFPQITSNENNIIVKIFPCEVIIGIESFEEINVSLINANISALNWFYMRSMLNEVFDRSDDDNSLYTYRLDISEPSLEAKWGEGKIIMSRGCSFDDGICNYTFSYLNNITYIPEQKTELMSALKQLAAFRSLLVLFADYGINFPSEIEIDCGVKLYNYLGEDCGIGHCTVYLNDSAFFKKEIDEPFRLTYNMVKGKFHEICSQYQFFYENNRPIIETYFEIITGYSRRINGFLDLTRIIETYSRRNRQNEARQICKRINTDCKSSKKTDTGCSKCDKVNQKYRYIDMFIEHSNNLTKRRYFPEHFNNESSIEITEQNIIDVCDNITALRNYHTHYYEMPKKLKTLYDKYGDLVYSDYSNLLNLIMLSAIYKNIGFSDDEIKLALSGGEAYRLGTPLSEKYDAPQT